MAVGATYGHGRVAARPETRVLEPQSTLFFLFLLVVFGLLVWWLVTARRLVFRVLAACLAFVPAMMFGVAAVNRYYDYYQSWGAAISDLTNSGVPAAPTVVARPGTRLSALLGQSVDTSLALQQGFTLRVNVTGRLSHVHRAVYIYLPPQYFQPAYARYRFPVIELLHGFPGGPQDWITLLAVNSTLDSLVSHHLAKPAVLVMPDANGKRGVSLQCLNQWHGPQDDTFLARDVPAFISRSLRVQPPGDGWGIAGYSEGGFCAANLGLQDSRVFSYAGVMSGYFVPSDNQLVSPSRTVSAFHTKRQRARNTPLEEIRTLPRRNLIPQFWIGTGGQNPADVRASEVFRQLVELRRPVTPLKIVAGGGHTMYTWRVLLPQLLTWMTPRLAQEAATADARAARLGRISRPATAAGRPHRKPDVSPRGHPSARHRSRPHHHRTRKKTGRTRKS
jgi:enterochelin esterase-like enzyme